MSISLASQPSAESTKLQTVRIRSRDLLLVILELRPVGSALGAFPGCRSIQLA